MSSVISLLYWENLHTSDENVIKLVEFFGGTVRPVEMSGNADPEQTNIGSGACVMTSAQTLTHLLAANAEMALQSLAAKLFVYGFEPGPEHATALQKVTAGNLTEVIRTSKSNDEVRVAPDEICRQMSGLHFSVREADVWPVFLEGAGDQSCRPLISLGEKPFLVRIQRQGFDGLIAAGPVADLLASIHPGGSVLDFFTGLAPVLISLHHFLRQQLWHNDTPTACFIVDDPLLKKRYGWLDYEKLVELVDRKRFSASIAFIPWNYRRSKRRVVELFKGRSISLCIHGCDHTWGEFGSQDTLLLRQRALQALDRMKLHKRLSGLDFDNVMVFPQGIFSKAAMSALKSSGYLAAINSSLFSIDADNGLVLKDLLQVAVTRYSNFPLFGRWYPSQVPELAFNLFLGKPAVLVEHHEYFRNGYGALAETIEKLRELEPGLRWTNPATICANACWTKVADNGDVHVLFLTDRFVFRNDSDRSRQYSLRRQGVTEGGVDVSVNGRAADFLQDHAGLTVNVLLKAGEQAEILITDSKFRVHTPPAETRLAYAAKVFVRRHLTEFRDNYLGVLQSKKTPPARVNDV